MMQGMKTGKVNKMDQGKKMALRIKLAQAEREILNNEEVLNDNISWIEFIEGFNVMVKVNGKDIPVDKKNISYFQENQDLIKARIESLKSKANAIRDELKESD